jgi:hypothetical protein
MALGAAIAVEAWSKTNTSLAGDGAGDGIDFAKPSFGGCEKCRFIGVQAS